MSDSPHVGATDPDDLVVIVGTRPEAIKLAGVVRLLGSRARAVHTGQHYDAAMWSDVVHQLGGVEISASIKIGGKSRGQQIGAAVSGLSDYLRLHPARGVIVQGDTNSTLAGAIAASTLRLPVIHVEAGLRSHDRAMPEEINRILVDAAADLCCAPLEANADQLRLEGIEEGRIVVTGNTLADALDFLRLPPTAQDRVLKDLSLSAGHYVLATIHRAATVDDAERLGPILEAIGQLARRIPVIVPLHPHTARSIERFGLEHLVRSVRLVQPLPPQEFLALEEQAALLVSDSGGVQEEACFFRRPLVVLRDSTERPELLDGWCRLVGPQDPREVLDLAWSELPSWSKSLRERPLPYRTGGASQKIVAAINARW